MMNNLTIRINDPLRKIAEERAQAYEVSLGAYIRQLIIMDVNHRKGEY